MSTRGTSASSTARATSAIRAAGASRKPPGTGMRSWWPTSTSTRSSRCVTCGSSTETGDPRHTGRSPRRSEHSRSIGDPAAGPSAARCVFKRPRRSSGAETGRRAARESQRRFHADLVRHSIRAVPGVVDSRVTRPRRVSLQWPAPRDRDPRPPPSGCGAFEDSPRVLAVRRTGWWPQDRRVLAALAATREEYRFIDDLLLSRRIRQNRSDPARRATIRTGQRSNELSELRVDDRQAVPALDVGHVRDAEQTAYLVLGNLQRPG